MSSLHLLGSQITVRRKLLLTEAMIVESSAYKADLATERERQLMTGTQIKKLAWPMAEWQIGHWKWCLVLSACFPIVN